MSASEHGLFVVTGASSGIGEALSRKLLARGETVLLVARREEKLAIIAHEFSRAHFFAIDCAADDAPERVMEAAAKIAKIRGFVHCAGFDAPAPLAQISPSIAKNLFSVHALFAMRFLGLMGRANNHVAGARAVLVSSVATREGAIGSAAYAAAKGAVEGFLASARAELARRDVRVELIAPDVVDTPMVREGWLRWASDERKADLQRKFPNGLPTADEAADEILNVLFDGEIAK